jgi:membrane-bound metal-dependent hydrolase YbcI (DUF457 family)
VLFWFAGTAVVTVWFVFHDPRFDYRLLIVGAVAPDILDAVFGGAAVLHSLTGCVAVLVVVMLATIGRRGVRRRLLALPIGMFLHLVFDGVFTDTEVLWWPFSGAQLGDAALPVVDRGAWNVLLEVVGLGLCWWAVRRFGLTDAERRRRFWREGVLEPC